MVEAASPSETASPTLVEQPTSSARMSVSLRPVELEGTAEGVVPAAEAHALIATFGMVAMGVAGIAGAAITLQMAPPRALSRSFGLALAELVLALIVIVLIAWRDHLPAGHNARKSPDRGSKRRRRLQPLWRPRTTFCNLFATSPRVTATSSDVLGGSCLLIRTLRTLVTMASCFGMLPLASWPSSWGIAGF